MSKFGAEVLNVWDEAICTHLIVDEGMDAERLKRIMKIEKAPSNACVIKANWLSLCLEEKQLMPTDNHTLRFPVLKKEDTPRKIDASTPVACTKLTNDKSETAESFKIKNEIHPTKTDGSNTSDMPTTSNAPAIPGTKWTSPVKAVGSDRGYDSDDSNYVPSDDDEYQEGVMVTTASDTGSSSNVSTPASSPQKLPVS